MPDEFDAFFEEHLKQHKSRFNKWCVVLADSVLMAGELALLSKRLRPLALKLIGAGLGTMVIGHVVDGTVSDALSGFVEHPVWSVRADVKMARSMLGV